MVRGRERVEEKEEEKESGKGDGVERCRHFLDVGTEGVWSGVEWSGVEKMLTEK